jgi:two-component system chemotaxis response regulator CheB
MEKGEITTAACEVLVIGGSAGSIEVLLKILPAVKKQISFAIVIVLHRKKSADSTLADLLATRTQYPVKEIEDKEPMKPGCIYVVPADYHLLFEKNKLLSLDYSEKINYSRPSIDVTFESGAETFGKSIACLLLSGANADGSAGLKLVKEKGGNVAVQDPATAESPQMPDYAIKIAEVKQILNLQQIGVFINSL